MKDYPLKSGERQVGTKLADIRADHIARYMMVVDKINDEYTDATDASDVYGLDMFCGNGYGTHILATETKSVVHGIDASTAAIQLANEHYGTQNTHFSVKEFPFNLPDETYDFVVSMESVEHVPDSSLLIKALIGAVRPGGFLFLSTPNSKSLSLELTPNKFHYRHFTYDELIEIVAGIDPKMELVNYFGQDCYIMNNGRVAGRGPDSIMNLRPEYIDGQFHCFIFFKNLLKK